jgi:predicted GNAT superfamily acetyltransferase
MQLRNIGPRDFPRLLALNNAHAAEVNELTMEEFERSVSIASTARVVEDGPGFLIAFDEGTPAQGPNHAWFAARYAAFLYIDRIIIAAEARGRGLARALYADVARTAARRPLCCEVNIEPLNSASLAFHARLGFVPCGEATDPRNLKKVRYLRRDAQ